MTAPPEPCAESVEAIAAALRAANRVAFITGAGLSAESGLPTYRGVGGLYNGITREEGLPIEEILSGEMLARAPEITWKYLLEIGRACHDAGPNRAHALIQSLEALCEVWVFTQNVDGFHSRAGSSRVVELHGRLDELHCTHCGVTAPAQKAFELPLPPRCAHCQGVLRPSVVLFGEMLPEPAIARYQRELLRGFEVIFVVGTSAGFPYISEPVITARRRGTLTVEINPERTALSNRVDHRLACGARRGLEALQLRTGWGHS